MTNINADINRIIEKHLDDFVAIMQLYLSAEFGEITRFQNYDLRINQTNKLRLQTGALYKSFFKKRDLKYSNGMVEGSIGSELKYANIHEYGGTIKVTQKMSNFALAMYIKTKNKLWLGIRSKYYQNKSMIIKKRPYFNPFISEMNKSGIKEWWDMVEDSLTNYAMYGKL